MKKLTCVLRNVAGIDQYVPVSDVPFFNADEPVFTGEFRLETAKDGPSGSHVRTICLPVGTPARSNVVSCVIREVNGVNEYVPVAEVPFLTPGETVFIGLWDSYQVNAGPSGSHRRTLCTPLSKLTETKAAKQAA